LLKNTQRLFIIQPYRQITAGKSWTGILQKLQMAIGAASLPRNTALLHWRN